MAFLAVLTLRSGIENTTDSGQIAAAVQTEGADVDAAEFTYVVPQTPVRRPTAAPARLTSYMMMHGEYSSSLGPNGAMTGLVANQPEGEPQVEEDDNLGSEKVE